MKLKHYFIKCIHCLFFVIVVLILVECKTDNTIHSAREFDQTLANRLLAMEKVDQVAAYIPQGKYKSLSKEEWHAFKDSVFQTHKIELQKIFKLKGYPDYDLVGKEGEHAFWLMVQHCDDDPAFQRSVLTAMKPLLKKGKASASSYAYLTDRVMKNTNRKLVYGTQVKYNRETGQASPLPLQDSLNVNIRRKEMGLEPIEIYLNRMTQSHFSMNAERMHERGISKPMLYEIEGDMIE